jgi:hypothetical protein
MGWVTEKFSDGVPMNQSASPAPEHSFEGSAESVWQVLVSGFEADVTEINQRKGDADFKELSAHEARISCSASKIAVMVAADLDAHTIQYVYVPEDTQTAVPEQGVLTMRASAEGIQLYSADEHLTSEQARQLILEPLFFANPPLAATGT